MPLVSLVAHCDQCPRVFAAVSIGDRRWFANIDEANAAYGAAQKLRQM
jgi:hypothetical protein